MVRLNKLLRSDLFKYYYSNIMSYVRQARSHTCTRGPASVHLSMRSAFYGHLILGRNGALVSRYILSLVAEKKSKYGVQRGETGRVL